MKRIKKSLTILTIFALLSGVCVNVPEAAAKKTAQKAKSLSLNYKKKTLQVGGTLKLKAKLKPKKAKAKIKWTSSNKKVATVNAKGKVKAKKKGTVKITAAVKGTKLKKSCKIKVTAKKAVVSTPDAGQTSVPTQKPVSPSPTAEPTPEPVKDTAVITSQDDVKKALAEAEADDKITTVKIKTDKNVEIELPEEDHSSLGLVIEAPRADVSNHAVFKNITINEIAKDTYKEYAEGNVINANCPIGRIIITDRAKAKLTILKEASNIEVVVNGDVTGIDVRGKNSIIDISGTSEAPVKVDAGVVSEIRTSHVLEVNASKKITFVMYPGAEDSEFYVENAGLIPEVYGVGSIKVMLEGTGDVQTVIAEYRDEVSGEQQIVSLGGSIVDADSGEPIGDANVYLVPYTNNFDEAGIEENEYRKTTVTDSTGKYTIDSIHTGNYIMVVKEPGMVTAVQYLVITSRYGGVFQNETLLLFPQTEDNATGSITGTLSNSLDGKPIEGLTARLRKGKGNTVGSVLKKTVSDEDGSYTFEGVEPGYYTVEFVDLRTGQTDGSYISTSMNAAVRSGRTDVVSTALTKSVASSQVRFVLTWGDKSSGAPADLDSHLTGPKKEGSGRFHTYFANVTYEEDDIHYADLDYDDTTWEGPETTTIYEAVPGVYDFYIHDFSNQELSRSSALATSGAKVEIYQGTTLMVTYYVPNKEGTLWHVCSYDSTTGRLVQNNEMYYESSSSYVGLDPKDRALESLDNCLSDLNAVLESLEDNAAKTALQRKYETYKAYYEEDTADSSLEDIQKRIAEVSDLMDDINNSLYIDYICFDEGSGDYADFHNTRASVTIYTLSPSDIKISEIVVPTGVDYELVKGEDGLLSAIRLMSADGYVKRYTVSFDLPSEYFDIGEVTGTNVSQWGRQTEYDEDDNIKGYTLNIYTKDGNPCDFTVTLEYDDKAVATCKRDADGKITEVSIKVGNAERIYRVEYSFDEELLLPSEICTSEEEELNWDYDWDWNDDDEKEYYIGVLTDTGAGCDFTVTPRMEDVRVEYVRDETTGFVKSLTMSAAGGRRTYQVRYSFDWSMLYPKGIVSDEVLDWEWDYNWNEDDEEEYYIDIWTETGDSCDFTVTLRSSKAAVSYGREDGVITSVTIRLGEYTRTFSVNYREW